MVEAQERLEAMQQQGAGQRQAKFAMADVEAAKRWLEHIRREQAVRAGQIALLERMVRLGMNLEGINASGVSLYRADLANAKFTNTDLEEAILMGTRRRSTGRMLLVQLSKLRVGKDSSGSSVIVFASQF